MVRYTCALLLMFVLQGAFASDAQAFGPRRKKGTTVKAPTRKLTDPYPSVQLVAAKEIRFPAPSDSNSPSFWADGTFHQFNSSRTAWRSTGSSIFDVGGTEVVQWDSFRFGDRWIEGVWKDEESGILFGWYHNEPSPCPNLAAPVIGAGMSLDNGSNWVDLGVILRAREGTDECDTRNHYFAGGIGDPSIMLDSNREYLYIYFGNYAGDVSEQGVGVARMRWEDRYDPVGKVWKYANGTWDEPGLGGTITPIFKSDVKMQDENALFYWGPAIHWNTYLGQYVVLLNRSLGTNFDEEGIYVSFAKDLADPGAWSPVKLVLKGGTWYPQVVGDASIQGTDKLAGQRARFFNGGVSRHEIRFKRPGEN